MHTGRDTPVTVTQQAALMTPNVYRDNHPMEVHDMDAITIDMPVTETNTSRKRGFWSVWATQFQESLSDNAYRFLVISFVADMAFAPETRGYLTLLAGILFAMPFVLFSPAGGYLADRYSKRSVIVGT